MARRKRHDPFGPAVEEWVAASEERDGM